MISNRGIEPVEHMAMPVLPVHCNDGGGRQAGIFKPEGGCGLVEVKAEISSVDRIQSAVGELIDLLAFAKLGAFGEIVRGDYCLIEVIVEFFKLLVHSFCLLAYD